MKPNQTRRYKTVNGTPIERYHSQPHPAGAMSVTKIEQGKRYRLCQIMPPIPQRFEWINEGNIRVEKTNA
jgi:hypothetical protein